MPSMCEKVRTQKKSVSPSYTQRVYVYSKHTCRCKSTSSEKRKCTRGVPHIYPFIPHGYLPTLLQAIHSPDGTKESISVSFNSNSKRSRGQCRFENADHVISHWRGEGAEFGAVPSENVRVVQPLTLPDSLKILITWTIRVTKILITRDHPLTSKGRSLGRCRLKHSCRSTFDLTRFLLMTPYCACPSQKWGGSSGKNKNLFCRRRSF